MILYEIRNDINNKVYVGITRRNTLKARWACHKHSAKSNTDTPLYRAMRKYGIDQFYIKEIKRLATEQELLLAEKDLIAFYRQQSNCYNILDGGESYFPITDKEAWKNKLKEKRKGKKPALGMKHTEENKKLFSLCGKARWDKYGRYPDNVTDLGFTKANKKYGISKTHYYRLKKLARSSDSC